jgi:hypothetical protein
MICVSMQIFVSGNTIEIAIDAKRTLLSLSFVACFEFTCELVLDESVLIIAITRRDQNR